MTGMPVMLSWLCLEAYAWHFHCLFLSFSPGYLTVIRMINCSIKASLRIQNALDTQLLGIRVVQLLWRTRLLRATDNQHVTLIKRQMGLFIRRSRQMENWNIRLMILDLQDWWIGNTITKWNVALCYILWGSLMEKSSIKMYPHW